MAVGIELAALRPASRDPAARPTEIPTGGRRTATPTGLTPPRAPPLPPAPCAPAPPTRSPLPLPRPSCPLASKLQPGRTPAAPRLPRRLPACCFPSGKFPSAPRAEDPCCCCWGPVQGLAASPKFHDWPAPTQERGWDGKGSVARVILSSRACGRACGTPNVVLDLVLIPSEPSDNRM